MAANNLAYLIGRISSGQKKCFENNGKAFLRFQLTVERLGADPPFDIDCLAFGKMAIQLAKFSVPGRLLAISGIIRPPHSRQEHPTRPWTIEIEDIQFLD